MTQYPGWESNPQAPGFKPGRSAVGVPGPIARRKPWDSNPQAAQAATCFQDRLLIRPDDFRELEPEFRGLESNQRPPRSERGVTTSSNCPGVREGGFEPPPPDSKSGSLPLADSRERPAGVEPACRTWQARLTARPGTHQHRFECGIGESNPGRLVGSQESCHWTNPADCRRKERESNPQGSSLARVRAGCRRPSACPSESSSSGGRNRTCVLPVNSRVLVPARAPPESIASDSRDGRIRTGDLLLPKQADCQAFPHPESSRSPTSAQRESNPHVRHGKAVGCRYIMGTIAVPELSKSREHRVGLEPTSPPYEVRSLRRWTTSACIASGTGGARTLTEPVKSRTFCR